MSNQVLLMDNRQLIPRWHTSRKGMSLQFPTLSKTSVDPEGFIDDESLVEARDAWNEEQNYFNAMELYTALLVKSLFNDSDFDDTLNFLLSMGNALPKGAYDLIAPDNKYIDKELKYYTYAPDRVHKIIARLRSIVRKFPHDYMTWNDIAFYYTVLGLDKKAAESIEIAWLLCDGHPYIARGYSRFLVHKGEPEKAIWILKKSGGLYHDPLITSAGLAIGNAFEIPSVDVVKSRSLLQHFNGFKPFTSELSATLGTLEFNNGRKKKAKDFFSRALELPSENALSQYKWFLN
jgi:tetratricopeptide (TPR) repeat protein